MHLFTQTQKNTAHIHETLGIILDLVKFCLLFHTCHLRFRYDVVFVVFRLQFCLDSIAVSLFGNMTAETEEILTITKEYQKKRSK